jgi:hypothetical protein
LLVVGVFGSREKTKSQTVEQQAPTMEEVRRFNEARVDELSRQIVGKEGQPAESGFKNIIMFKYQQAGF